MTTSLLKIQAHPWNLSPSAAIRLQRELSTLVIESGKLDNLQTIAGCDMAIDRKNNLAFGAMVLLKYPSMELISEITHVGSLDFPYIPGLLSFRECPIYLQLFDKIKDSPDLVIFDGHGLSHPRYLGIACHMGLLLGIPTMGIAKSHLFGHADENLGEAKGSMVDLVDNDDRIIGRVLRTRDNVSPVYVSIGHGVELDEACRIALSCTAKLRIPEPTRLADKLAAKAKRLAL